MRTYGIPLIILSFTILCGHAMRAEAAVREYAVEVSASVQEFPPGIHFSWTADPAAEQYYVFKKRVSDETWTGPITVLNGAATAFTDTSVEIGVAYEYGFLKTLCFHTETIPVADGTPVTFTIYDSWGDGMCCHRGIGGYEVTGCGEVYASGGEFGSEESTSFTVGEPGGPCHELTVNITLDVFGTETSWTLTEDGSGAVLGQGGPYDSPHFGHICTGIRCSAQEGRKTLLLIIEGRVADSISFEVNRLIRDLLGDGYRVIRHTTGPDEGVTDIKAWIKAQCAGDQTIGTIFLIGHVPVPYSGDVQNAHSNHRGAWPADLYYAELDGEWTDETVNNTSASRPENHNVPGDGKFDQTFLPSDVDLEIGRVDLWNLPAFEPLSDVDLLKRYLDKDHAWRRGEIRAEPRGLIDDNVGDGWGRAVAASAWRNFSNMFGAENVFPGDFFPDLETESYLWSYGCGGSGYTSCGGVGTTDDFASRTVLSVFTILYGSYFGDWDNSNNILRSPLGANGYPLVNFYSGRPVWNAHHMALGYPVGYTARLNQNNDHEYTVADGGRQIYIALIGDPTLKMHVVKPVSDLEVERMGVRWIRLTWTASEDDVAGYYVYRAGGLDAFFERIHGDPVTGTTFVDADPLPGNNVYLVRALKLETSGSGTFYNLSCGEMGSLEPLPQVLSGPGPAFDNLPLVRTFPPQQDAGFEHEFAAYGTSHFGTDLTCGDVDRDAFDEIITGPGAGPILGPHVRGFRMDGTPVPGLSFLAYGTHKWGVRVAAGDLDGDGFDEIITGPGPGTVFGPHVRAFDYDGTPSVTPVPGVSFFAYGTRKWGVNVSAGDIDGDGFDEIITGPGPGVIFGPHVRGWNYDGGLAVSHIAAVSYMAFNARRYGVRAACGDIDGDGFDEIITAPGPSGFFTAHIRGWNFDGASIFPLPGCSFFAWPSSQARYGARIDAGADLNTDGRDEIVAGCGPDPAAAAAVKVFKYDGAHAEAWFSFQAYPGGWTHGVCVAAGRF